MREGWRRRCFEAVRRTCAACACCTAPTVALGPRFADLAGTFKVHIVCCSKNDIVAGAVRCPIADGATIPRRRWSGRSHCANIVIELAAGIAAASLGPSTKGAPVMERRGTDAATGAEALDKRRHQRRRRNPSRDRGPTSEHETQPIADNERGGGEHMAERAERNVTRERESNRTNSSAFTRASSSDARRKSTRASDASQAKDSQHKDPRQDEHHRRYPRHRTRQSHAQP